MICLLIAIALPYSIKKCGDTTWWHLDRGDRLFWTWMLACGITVM